MNIYVCTKCRIGESVIESNSDFPPTKCPYYNDNGMRYGWKIREEVKQ